MSVIYGNPIIAGGGSKPQSGKWDERYKKICTPTITNISSAITVKALTCRDGYLYGIGNDSAGNVYKLYGGMNSNLSAVKTSSSGKYNPIGITCDGINVVWALGLPQYKSRFISWQAVNTFKSTATGFKQSSITSTVFGPTDICSTIEDAAGHEPNVWMSGEINNEAAEEQQVEEETVAESETVSVEEPAVEETANAEEPAAEETESKTEITAEELGNLVKEFENPEEKLSEKLAESGDIEETVKEEIERVTEIEQKLEKDIAKIEGDAKKPENKPRNIFYNPSFNDFWNGVGETI